VKRGKNPRGTEKTSEGEGTFVFLGETSKGRAVRGLSMSEKKKKRKKYTGNYHKG